MIGDDARRTVYGGIVGYTYLLPRMTTELRPVTSIQLMLYRCWFGFAAASRWTSRGTALMGAVGDDGIIRPRERTEPAIDVRVTRAVEVARDVADPEEYD